MREFNDDNDPKEPDMVSSPRFGRLLLVLLGAVLVVVMITFAAEAYYTP